MKFLVLGGIIGIIIGIYLGMFFGSQTVYISYYNYTLPEYNPFVNLSENGSIVSMMIPAVDENGNGVMTFLSVQAVPGSGKRLVNIDKILFWIDTQNSIRTAGFVAQNITGINISKYDLIYTITANASVLEGPSAGAALGIATIAALEGKSLRKDVVITGTLNHDGTLGPVGGVVEKARAAKSAGIKIILVPLGQGEEVSYRSQRYCEKIGWTEICTIEHIPHKVDIEDEVGIQVIEVKDIEEALNYFFGEEE